MEPSSNVMVMRSVRPIRPTTADAIHETSAICIRCRSVRRSWSVSPAAALVELGTREF